jgi:hypothetical protein
VPAPARWRSTAAPGWGGGTRRTNRGWGRRARAAVRAPAGAQSGRRRARPAWGCGALWAGRPARAGALSPGAYRDLRVEGCIGYVVIAPHLLSWTSFPGRSPAARPAVGRRRPDGRPAGSIAPGITSHQRCAAREVSGPGPGYRASGRRAWVGIESGAPPRAIMVLGGLARVGVLLSVPRARRPPRGAGALRSVTAPGLRPGLG